MHSLCSCLLLHKTFIFNRAERIVCTNLIYNVMPLPHAYKGGGGGGGGGGPEGGVSGEVREQCVKGREG